MSLKYVHSLQLTRTPRPTRLSQLSFRLKLDHAMFRSHDKCWPLTTRSVGRFLMPVRSPHAPSSTPAAPPQTLRSTLIADGPRILTATTNEPVLLRGTPRSTVVSSNRVEYSGLTGCVANILKGFLHGATPVSPVLSVCASRNCAMCRCPCVRSGFPLLSSVRSLTRQRLPPTVRSLTLASSGRYLPHRP